MMVFGDPKAWQKRLRDAVIRYCDDNGYVTTTRLQTQLGISRSAWNEIRSGNAIVTDTYAYAKLFAIGIMEADPTDIPDRKRVVRGKPVPLRRAWPQDKLEEFLEQWNAGQFAEAASDTEKPAKPRVRKVERPQVSVEAVQPRPPEVRQAPNTKRGTLGSSLGGFLDLVLEQAGLQIGEAAARVLEKRLAANIPAPGSVLFPELETSDPGVLVRRLYGALQPLLQDSTEERNRFVSLYGRDIGRLLPVLDALTEVEASRERSLKRIMEVEL